MGVFWMLACPSQSLHRLTAARAQQDNAPMSESPPEAATAETRRLAAIMFTDIVGLSRQMGSNEARMLRLLATRNLMTVCSFAHWSHIGGKQTGTLFGYALLLIRSEIETGSLSDIVHRQRRAGVYRVPGSDLYNCLL